TCAAAPVLDGPGDGRVAGVGQFAVPGSQALEDLWRLRGPHRTGVSDDVRLEVGVEPGAELVSEGLGLRRVVEVHCCGCLPALSSPITCTWPSVSPMYSGPSAVGTNHPVGHMVRTSTIEKPSRATWASNAVRIIRLVRATAPAFCTEPRAT